MDSTYLPEGHVFSTPLSYPVLSFIQGANYPGKPEKQNADET